MRRFDKDKNIEKVNLLAEQRHLNTKELIKEIKNNFMYKITGPYGFIESDGFNKGSFFELNGAVIALFRYLKSEDGIFDTNTYIEEGMGEDNYQIIKDDGDNYKTIISIPIKSVSTIEAINKLESNKKIQKSLTIKR